MSDLIKRSDAIKIMACEMYAEAQSQGYEVDSIEDFMPEAKAWMNDAPSADRPQGEWVPFEYGDERWHKCTACGVADRYIEYVERPNGTMGKLVAIRNYCPNCGAKMKGADDE